MFEKEADEYSNNWKIHKDSKLTFAEAVELRAVIYKANKDGAQFGYNKANEWHDLRKDPNDVPHDYRYVWTNIGACYLDDEGEWRDAFGRVQGVIAWCEPEFEEIEE